MKMIQFEFSLQFVPVSRTDNKPALVQGLAGNNPLTEPMLTQFTDSYMRYQREMVWIQFGN